MDTYGFVTTQCFHDIKGLHDLGDEFTLIFWYWSEGSTIVSSNPNLLSSHSNKVVSTGGEGRR
ncbi:hypothetical protein DEO72_LG8g655 [Vigna unguiculata]|uniref:Uncharacterized protein n=1 Tax=Vigna unguiculata TaxID=3917 RepID=A0A4D6MM36_VIGUN|nr:hypothetical protein DEO72_LG8g655 [Vigna unguiculata]